MSSRTPVEYIDDPNPIKISGAGVPKGGVTVRRPTDEEVAAWRASEESLRVWNDPIVEQANGARFSREATLRISCGNPVDGEAAELLRSLWDSHGATASTPKLMGLLLRGGRGQEAQLSDAEPAVADSGGIWNGLQAIAYLAGCDMSVVSKLGDRIEYRDHGRRRLLLNLRHVSRLLHQEIAERHCRCEAKKSRLPADCDCPDAAAFLISDALRRGKIPDIRTGTREPLALDNAWGREFRRSDVEQLAAARAGAGAPG